MLYGWKYSFNYYHWFSFAFILLFNIICASICCCVVKAMLKKNIFSSWMNNIFHLRVCSIGLEKSIYEWLNIHLIIELFYILDHLSFLFLFLFLLYLKFCCHLQYIHWIRRQRRCSRMYCQIIFDMWNMVIYFILICMEYIGYLAIWYYMRYPVFICVFWWCNLNNEEFV